jgi:hypothetical protein
MAKQKQFYIFEGPDRVGKSTFVQAMAYTYNLPLYHFGKPDPVAQGIRGVQYQYYPLIDLPTSAVLDRSWVSGFFYDIFRRNQVPNFESAVELTQKFSHQLNYVYVHRPLSKSLVEGHQQEIKDGMGYGTLEERIIEHINWPYFIASLSKVFDANQYLWVVSNLQLVNQQNQFIVDVCNDQRVRPTTFEFSEAILDFAKPETENGHLASLWSQYGWEDPESNRNRSIIEDIKKQSAFYYRNRIR